ncbi:uncharacterized protein FFUJ_13734 [Fusarium fujikuroi IMI 58289]|uniref:Uncharacterized protein n=1 Tax=Gibberella fujikuroi (strain CBS 195.34 / IMI 58289 / NRRL A-6831) TaxID=1279085 RepID=S0EEG6_GIBF5|nr:uncharacterized protein FFUJ_13734 [Fusarium fujikuroi IMI 58289]CCT72257.1 uncharacterized protein FFUJ_13734 [Fusarium fujikuroi IMI 58289]SCO55172.1 uncharacterized protein FFMR_12328 [Fusarium fujikuroi]
MRSAIIQCDFTLEQPWQWGKNYNESGVSGILDVEELCISSLDFGSDDDLHATTNLLDWERVQKDCFEIEELSGDVFAEPFDGRYQVNKPRICFRLSHCYCNSQSYSKIIAWHYRDMIGVMAFSVSSGVLVVFQQIEDCSTEELPETAKTGKWKLREAFTTASKNMKPRNLGSTDANQRSQHTIGKIKLTPKAETTITTPT